MVTAQLYFQIGFLFNIQGKFQPVVEKEENFKTGIQSRTTIPCEYKYQKETVPRSLSSLMEQWNLPLRQTLHAWLSVV